MHRDADDFFGIEPRGEGAGVEVAHDGADHEDAVAAFDEAADVLVEERAFVHAHVLRVLLVNDRLVPEHGGEGEAGVLDDGAHGIGEAGAREEHAGQDAGGAGFAEGLDDGVSGGGERVGVALRHGEGGARGAEDGLVGEVGGEREVGGAAAVERLGDDALGLEHDVLRRDDGARADDGLGHAVEEIVLAVAEGCGA